MNRNGNSQFFSRMFVMAKKIKQLFTSTLNGLTASVRCVSSMIVVLNSKLARLKDGEKRRSPTRVLCFAS